MKKYNEILESVPLFRGISEEERQQMLDCLRAQQQRFAAGRGDPAGRGSGGPRGRAFGGARAGDPGGIFGQPDDFNRPKPGQPLCRGVRLRLRGTQNAPGHRAGGGRERCTVDGLPENFACLPCGLRLPPPVGGKYACGGRGQKFDAQPPDRASLEAQHAGKSCSPISRSRPPCTAARHFPFPLTGSSWRTTSVWSAAPCPRFCPSCARRASSRWNGTASGSSSSPARRPL